ncbi:MAG: M23 family metallopeptidase [Deltaproteobacteria bacterium]|nr:M23 family metallopeptidase [Deltaproteobacteria bacterium]
MGKLYFKEPVNKNIERNDGFGEIRKDGRTHYGIDYDSPAGTEIRASERGKVVRASFVPKDGNYGYTVIIDHTPEASDNERHIYTLYAHLSSLNVSCGDMVSQEQAIGLSGNTGTASFYRNTGRQFHLHFEVIDTRESGKMNWNSEGGTGYNGHVNRVNPDGYFGNPDLEVNGTVGDHPISEQYLEEILDRMDLKLDEEFRLQIMVDGKNVGCFGNGNETIEMKIRI